MTEPHYRPDDVELFTARRIRLIEGPAPMLPPEHRREMDRVWGESVAANPALFDGPAVACTRVCSDGTDTLVVSWARVTYRYHALRRVYGAAAQPMLFVAVVQPAKEGGVLVGRMAPSTSSPLRWQLPGGGVEPPRDGEVLDEAALRGHAARELLEETGLETRPEELALLAMVRRRNGNIGIVYRAVPRPAAVLHERFAAVVAAETAAGRDPELQEIAFLDSPGDLVNLSGPRSDYLTCVLARYTTVRPAE